MLAQTQADGKDKPVTAEKSKSGIVVKGIHDVAVRFSKCCSPVPGDEIVGFVTRGRGVSIHRTDCTNIVNLPESDRARIIDSERSLIFAGLVTILFCLIWYLPRKVLNFADFMESFVEGFRLMVPAMAILTFAWALKGIGDHLEISTFVKSVVGQNASARDRKSVV